ncbi:hypothetical protein G6F46_001695 [Rhizopus delemar]|uniref:Uncharacterized protein n=2 Tax=Rhizopus TaxID=4842 RepID=A0A9P7CTZ6_9FUNG|nr:hypothetical protein G6F55_000798 [Rhizopus delemar]KAG1551692.1 hypothetical protein G6F51_001678 [Rhizopus arrhizus]KAG1527705.1 hypothetical protein G6F52_001305 [Rhizopus delemar]KAG1560562.1 hypothetical protein G6F49_002596 [Rhizopus delemar]KAG1575069.1 hypothetical protein G6F50_001422 [Rhizopus delemar]
MLDSPQHDFEPVLKHVDTVLSNVEHRPAIEMESVALILVGSRRDAGKMTSKVRDPLADHDWKGNDGLSCSVQQSKSFINHL